MIKSVNGFPFSTDNMRVARESNEPWNVEIENPNSNQKPGSTANAIPGPLPNNPSNVSKGSGKGSRNEMSQGNARRGGREPRRHVQDDDGVEDILVKKKSKGQQNHHE